MPPRDLEYLHRSQDGPIIKQRTRGRDRILALTLNKPKWSHTVRPAPQRSDILLKRFALQAWFGHIAKIEGGRPDLIASWLDARKAQADLVNGSDEKENRRIKEERLDCIEEFKKAIEREYSALKSETRAQGLVMNGKLG